MNHFERIKRKLSYTKYLTPEKIYSLAKYYYDMKNKKIITSSFPPGLTFQTSSICNSNCKLCPVGLNIQRENDGFLKLKTFKKIITEAKECLVNVFFGQNCPVSQR